MKSFKTFLEDAGIALPSTNAGSGNIASIGVGEHGEPPGKPKKKTNLLKRKTPPA